jgi:hypothetical protein
MCLKEGDKLMRLQSKQQGRSLIGLLIGLAVIGYSTYFAIQYVPQFVESSAVGSILTGVAKSHKTNPLLSKEAVRKSLDKQLDVNQMYDMRDSFVVIPVADTFSIKASYERELNLVYTVRKIQYEKSITLK